MSKHIELHKYKKMLGFGIGFYALRPDTFLQIDFLYWQVRIGKL